MVSKIICSVGFGPSMYTGSVVLLFIILSLGNKFYDLINLYLFFANVVTAPFDSH